MSVQIDYDAPPLVLDGIEFAPRPADRELALRESLVVGFIELDELVNQWQARKFIDGALGDWKPMRCLAEARAFIVSKIRQS